MTPLIFNLGPMELVIILIIVLLLFGGSRLAGLGKSTGRAIKEFKEETKAPGDTRPSTTPPSAPALGGPDPRTEWPQSTVSDPVDRSETDVRRDA